MRDTVSLGVSANASVHSPAVTFNKYSMSDINSKLSSVLLEFGSFVY